MYLFPMQFKETKCGHCISFQSWALYVKPSYVNYSEAFTHRHAHTLTLTPSYQKTVLPQQQSVTVYRLHLSTHRLPALGRIYFIHIDRICYNMSEQIS